MIFFILKVIQAYLTIPLFNNQFMQILMNVEIRQIIAVLWPLVPTQWGLLFAIAMLDILVME